MTFRERIAEIVRDCLITGYEGSVNELVEKNTEDLLQAIREVVPKAKPLNYGGGGDIIWASNESVKQGHNACREAMLRALNSQEGNK